MIWLISDRHINHKKLQELTGRDVNFDERLNENIRTLVKSTDTVIDLGDVIIGKQSEFVNIQARLPGIWIMCEGNHDEKSQWYESRGIALCVKSFTRKWRGYNILFSHIPVVPLSKGIDYNVHGHWHNSIHRLEEYINDEIYLTNKHRYLLVEIESTCSPVQMEKFLSERIKS